MQRLFFVFLDASAVEFNSARQKIRRSQLALIPMFPTPPGDRPGA